MIINIILFICLIGIPIDNLTVIVMYNVCMVLEDIVLLLVGILVFRSLFAFVIYK